MSSDKDTKSVVSYVHWENSRYQCKECPMWIDTNLCLFMSPKDEVQGIDSCNYFVKGFRQSFGFVPLSFLTKDSAGWVRNEVGFSCKRCVHWDPQEWKCAEVDENSPGLDPGLIHPDACCNEWEADPRRGNMATEDFYEFS